MKSVERISKYRNLSTLDYDFIFLENYIRKMQANDRECFEKLVNIIKFVHLNKVDPDKFLTIKVAMIEFKKSNGRRMSIEELADFCKLEFEDFKFIDTLVHFYKDPESGKEAPKEGEKGDQAAARDYASDNF